MVSLSITNLPVSSDGSLVSSTASHRFSSSNKSKMTRRLRLILASRQNGSDSPGRDVVQKDNQLTELVYRRAVHNALSRTTNRSIFYRYSDKER